MKKDDLLKKLAQSSKDYDSEAALSKILKKPKNDKPSLDDAIGASTKDALTIGFWDEGKGAFDAIKNHKFEGSLSKQLEKFKNNYKMSRDEERAKDKAAYEAYPGSYITNNLALSAFMPVPGARVLGATKAAKYAAMLAKSAKAPSVVKSLAKRPGAIIQGAVAGAGSSESENLKDIAKDTLKAGATGFVAQKGVDKLVKSQPMKWAKDKSLGIAQNILFSNPNAKSHTERYLKDPDAINNAMPELEQKKIIDKVYAHLDKIKSEAKESHALNKQGIEDQVKIAKKLASNAHQESKDILKESNINLINKNPPDLSKDFVKSGALTEL